MLESSTPRRHGTPRQYQGHDSLIASLEEKYVLSEQKDTLDNSSSSDNLEYLPQEPLHMLGGMVSPHLVQAKASLCRSPPSSDETPSTLFEYGTSSTVNKGKDHLIAGLEGGMSWQSKGQYR